MSNKSRLQTNNTNLQALIDKANALPDAGGSGGGSVETCTITVMLDSPAPTFPQIIYTNTNMQIVSEDLEGQLSLTVVKGTILISSGGSSDDAVVSGDAERIGYGGGRAMFKINGDATISVSPM